MGQHPTKFTTITKRILHSDRRVLYPYNTFYIQIYQTILILSYAYFWCCRGTTPYTLMSSI